MPFSALKQIFGRLDEEVTEEEKRHKGFALVRIMFIVAVLGIAASLAIPYILQLR